MRIMKRPLALLLVVISLTLADTVWGQPATEQKQSRLYTMRPAGTELQLLTDAVLPEMRWNGSPEWSHDGTRIAFDATPERGEWRRSRIAVYHVSGEGQGTTHDLGLGNAPTWSPDDTQIAFFLNPGTAGGAKAGLWVMSADGTGREWLGQGYFPNWSPEGQLLVVQTSFASQRQILFFDTQLGKHTTLSNDLLRGTSQPTWAPDGRRLALVVGGRGPRSIQLIDVAGHDPGRQQVWPRGSEKQLPAGLVPTHLAWSPDGSTIFVRCERAGEDFCFLVPVKPAEDVRPIQPGILNGQVFDPAWSPDGRQIVFASDGELP